MRFFSSQLGLTLVELITTLSIFTTLAGLVTINLLSSQNKAVSNSNVEILLSDIKFQQVKAMVGETQGLSQSEYGIFFETNSYTLFQGTTYSAVDPKNITIEIDQPFEISTTFPGSIIVFEKGSGVVNNFTPGQNTISVSNNGSQDEVITINRLGVITDVN